MEPLFFFKNMQPADEAKLREYFFTKLSKFEKLLQRVPADGAVLQVKGEKFKKHNAFEVELTLKSGGKTFTACEASHLITKAVDLSVDRLGLQLKKSLTGSRRTHRGLRATSKPLFRVALSA